MAEAPPFIAYYRVSTEKQGRSQLGLEAQRGAVLAYVKAQGGQLLAEITEIASGAQADRPELKRALALAQRRRAVLAVAKLDRLSRSVAFLSDLIERKVRLVSCDNPHADPMLLQIMAVFAEHERREIGRRTRAALAVAKARGVRLGNPSLAAARALAVAASQAAADRFAATVMPQIADLEARGYSRRGIARELQARGVATAKGGQWDATTIRLLLARNQPPAPG